MIHEVIIPVMDQTTASVVLTHWLLAEGAIVKQGDVICKIETDKATVEIEATADGILGKALIETGTQIPPLTVVALIADPNEPLPNIDPYYRTNRAKPQNVPVMSVQVAPTFTLPQRIIASPRAKRLAEEHGLDLATIQGSGPNGRIQEEDVLQAITQPGPTQATRNTQAKVERVSQSWQTIPHFYTAITIDMSRVVTAKSEAGGQITYTDYMVSALVHTLPQHPTLNGHWQKGGLVALPEIHLGLVVQTERGLVIMTLPDMQHRSLTEIASQRARLVDQARAGKLDATAMTEPTFTLSNVGHGHIDHFTAIISPPQVAILSVGSIQARPWVVGLELVVRPTAIFTLGVDHRAIDGRQAAAFLEQLKNNLEQGASD